MFCFRHCVSVSETALYTFLESVNPTLTRQVCKTHMGRMHHCDCILLNPIFCVNSSEILSNGMLMCQM